MSRTITNRNISFNVPIMAINVETPSNCDRFGLIRFTTTVNKYSDDREKNWNEMQVKRRSFQFDSYKRVRQKLVVRLSSDVKTTDVLESNFTNR